MAFFTSKTSPFLSGLVF